MTPKSFSVRIYLQDGHADGVQIVAKSKWSGRSMVIPRDSLTSEVKRTELNAPGVYLLVGPRTGTGLQTLYIGEADPVGHDLERIDLKKFSWDRVVVFTSKDDSINRAHTQYLAARLMCLAKEVDRAHIDNLATPELPVLSATELADAESFLAHILSICPVLDVRVFEKRSLL